MNDLELYFEMGFKAIKARSGNSFAFFTFIYLGYANPAPLLPLIVGLVRPAISAYNCSNVSFFTGTLANIHFGYSLPFVTFLNKTAFMPESRNRHKHHHHHQAVPPQHTSRKVKRSAAFVVAIITAILGLVVAFFTQGADVFWLIIGAGSGAVIGYFVGHAMDKSIEKS